MTERRITLTFAILVLLFAGIGALVAVTAERTLDGLGRAPAPVERAKPRTGPALERRVTPFRAWQERYAAALASRRWEPMLEAGDAALGLGDGDARARARQAYLVAFTRARHEGSVDGVRRVAQAFAGLGDHEVAAQCLAVAERMER